VAATLTARERFEITRTLRHRLAKNLARIAELKRWAREHRQSVGFAEEYYRSEEIRFVLSLFDVVCPRCGQKHPPNADGKPRAHRCPHGAKCDGTCRKGWPCTGEKGKR